MATLLTKDRPLWAQGRMVAIVNPHAASGRALRTWEGLKRVADTWHMSLATWQTRRPKHATQLTQRALELNASALFVIGGDGTLNEVVNGLMANRNRPLPVLILIPGGTGSDFSRTLYAPELRHLSPQLFWEGIMSWPVVYADIGQLTLQGPGGIVQKYFANVADVGLGGVTASYVNHHSKRLGGRASFIVGAFKAYQIFHPQALTLTIDGYQTQMSPLTVVMANGAYFGGGMWIAPTARIDDGVLTVVLVDNVPRSFFLRHFLQVYRGRHTTLPGVRVMETQELRIDANTPLPLDIDGEDLLTKHIECRIIPAILPILRPIT